MGYKRICGECLMLKYEYTEMKWISNFQSYFLSLGYEKHKIGEMFTVKISDIPPGASVKVKCICDNCGEEFERKYFHVYGKEKHFCRKQECIVKQMSYYVNKKYGVDCSAKIPQSKEKRIKTFKSHYGKIENPEGNKKLHERKIQTHFEKTGYKTIVNDPNVKKKREETCEKKYGFKNPFLNPEIQRKIRIKATKTKSLYGKILTSKYQHRLFNLLKNSKENYAVDELAIDIAYPNNMIGIEYNGGGHYYNVLLGYETLEKAKERDKNRSYYLYNKGWKLIYIDHFVSKTIYDNKTMLQLIKFCKNYLLYSKRHWIRIDVDNNKIYSSKIEIKLNEKGDIYETFR